MQDIFRCSDSKYNEFQAHEMKWRAKTGWEVGNEYPDHMKKFQLRFGQHMCMLGHILTLRVMGGGLTAFSTKIMK